jgi:transcriptional regulator NrdR family protein
LGTKPDSLTRRWDVYPKGGNSDYAIVNPQNHRPVFTNNQLRASLRASALAAPVIRNTIIMDIEQLHADLRTSQPLDPVASLHLPVPSDPRWSISPDGLLQ